MQLFRTRRSDAEHVELVRRWLLRSKWIGIIYACCAAGFFAMFAMYWRFIPKLAGSGLESDQAAQRGFFIGVLLGAMAGLPLFFGVICAYLAMRPVTGQRTERLMVKFYDELKKRETHIQPTD